MNVLLMLLLVFGLFVISGKTQLPPEFTFTDNLYLDISDNLRGRLIEEYIDSLCKLYDQEVYLYIGADAIPLCKRKNNRGLLLFLLAILFKPTRDLLLRMIDDLIPGPGPVITTAAPPTVPPTTTQPVTPSG